MSSYFKDDEESVHDENSEVEDQDIIEDDISINSEDKEEEDIDEDEMEAVIPQEPAFNIENIIGQPDENEEEDDSDEEDDEHYLQKFDKEIHKNYAAAIHPECMIHNQAEIDVLTVVVRNFRGVIIDDLHKTLPFLTKYEKTRILGQRTIQINAGSQPFVKIPDKVIDGYVIAQIELAQKVIPFVIRRPLPNGTSEYWKVSDLENVLL